MLLRLLRPSSSSSSSGIRIGSRTGTYWQQQRLAHSSSRRSEPQNNDGWPHEVFSSETLTHRKSVFQAHATRFSLLPVDSGERGTSKVEDQLDGLFARIQKSYPRTKRATHRMWAYRCRDPTQTAIAPPDPLGSRAEKKKSSKLLKKIYNSPEQTANIKFTMASFSDVEPASGPILERLLELNHHEEVVVVVYRWYGGVHIGGDRWRCISGVASEALRLLGAKDGEGSSK
ncbi:hypothetical protein BC629DRAFT_1591756 [Irpex lacteus]|nr:hypothetical protein BC629DRAFT_1591756 [Irpex lacteus]